MPHTTKQQRGASRSGSGASPAQGRRSGGPSARARTPSGRSTSTSPRKPRTASARPRAAAKVSSRRRSVAAVVLRSLWIVMTVLGVGAVLVWAVYPAVRVQSETSRRVEGLQAEYETLRKKNVLLRAQVADLKTPEGVERAAREDLGLVLPGENVYVVVPSAVASGPATSKTAASDVAADPLTALLDALFGSR
jgi:cell division protein FtsL